MGNKKNQVVLLIKTLNLRWWWATINYSWLLLWILAA